MQPCVRHILVTSCHDFSNYRLTNEDMCILSQSITLASRAHCTEALIRDPLIGQSITSHQVTRTCPEQATKRNKEREERADFSKIVYTIDWYMYISYVYIPLSVFVSVQHIFIYLISHVLFYQIMLYVFVKYMCLDVHYLQT